MLTKKVADTSGLADLLLMQFKMRYPTLRIQSKKKNMMQKYRPFEKKKYYTTFYYKKFTNDTLDAKIKEKSWLINIMFLNL